MGLGKERNQECILKGGSRRLRNWHYIVEGEDWREEAWWGVEMGLGLASIMLHLQCLFGSPVGQLVRQLAPQFWSPREILRAVVQAWESLVN